MNMFKRFFRYPLIYGFLLLSGGILISSILAAICVFTIDGKNPPDGLLSIAGCISYFIIFLLVLCISKKVIRNRCLGFSKSGLKESLYLSLPSLLYLALMLYSEWDVFETYYLTKTPITIIKIVLMGIVSGFFDALVVQGLMMGDFMKRTGGKIYQSLLIPSAFLAGMNILVILSGLTEGEYGHTIYILIISIFLGAVYLRTKNLWGVAVSYSVLGITANLDELTPFVNPVNGVTETVLSGIIAGLLLLMAGYLVREGMQSSIKRLWQKKI